ncbi:MAG: hypothetical protein M9962_15740 [Oligoflexia bacterium]|nr:hypothetical protein [Oligoflexia bacterium]
MNYIYVLLPVIALYFFTETYFQWRPVKQSSKKWLQIIMLLLKIFTFIIFGIQFSVMLSLMIAPEKNMANVGLLGFTLVVFVVAIRLSVRTYQRCSVNKMPSEVLVVKKSLWIKLGIISLSLLVVSLALAVTSMKKRTEDVREICQISTHTEIENLIPKALALGFSLEHRSGLGEGIMLKDISGNKIRNFDNSLTSINQGTLRLGKISLPPFMRNYCHIEFRNRKVISTRLSTID